MPRRLGCARKVRVNYGLPRGALNSAVECHLHTVEVAGSNPAAPTISTNIINSLRDGIHANLVSYGTRTAYTSSDAAPARDALLLPSRGHSGS